MNPMITPQTGSTSCRPRISVLVAAIPLALTLMGPVAPLDAVTLNGDMVWYESTTPVAGDPERAAELEARALEIRDQASQRKEAARLYRQAADLRSAGDPMKVQSLRDAYHMNFHAGRTSRALEATEAAHLALRQGNVVVAAHVHVDAAWLAADLGEPAVAKQHLEDARMLAASPLLAHSQRVDLLNRLPAPA